jgi:hypothetical protein
VYPESGCVKGVGLDLVAGEIGSTVREEELVTFSGDSCCVSAERVAGTTHFVALQAGGVVRAAIDRVAAAGG